MLSTTVHHEMLGPLRCNVEFAEQLVERIHDPVLHRKAELIQISSKLVLFHTNDLLDLRFLHTGNFTPTFVQGSVLNAIFVCGNNSFQLPHRVFAPNLIVDRVRNPLHVRLHADATTATTATTIPRAASTAPSGTARAWASASRAAPPRTATAAVMTSMREGAVDGAAVKKHSESGAELVPTRRLWYQRVW